MTHKLEKLALLLMLASILMACNLSSFFTSSDDLPDLTVMNVSITSEITTCESDNILGTRIWIQNLGNSDVEGFSIRVNGTSYVVQDTVPANDMISLWFSGYHNAPEIILDESDEILELDESNNQFSQMVPVPTPILPCTPTANP